MSKKKEQNKAEKKKKAEEKKKEKTIDTILKDSGLFPARLSKVATVHGIKFHIRPLPGLVDTYITGKIIKIDGRIDLALRKIEHIRYGITKVCDKEGKEVEDIFETTEIMEREYKVLTLDFIDEDLPMEVMDILYLWISSLTHLSNKEIEKLDFTFPLAKKK